MQRALVATWYLKAREIEEAVMVSLMDALASVLPSFQLPPAIQSHTRHYMPGRGSDKPKVFDTFVQSCDPIFVQWDVNLSETQRKALGILCERIGYLGRAESIVEAALLSEDTAIKANSYPLAEEANLPENAELARVLSVSNPETYSIWATANQPKDDPKAKGKKGKVKVAPPLIPENIFKALHAETDKLQLQGWLIPPGSRWADYTRTVNAFEPASISPRRSQKKIVTVARFAVASTVLPRITQAVSVAERLHQSLVRWADGMKCANVFSGKGSDGSPLENHQHTHIFCELGEKRDSLGFITLFAPMGFNTEAQEVIENVQRKALWGHGGHDLDLILLGFGETDTFDIPLFTKSRLWTSLTPFVSTRHAKHYADGRPKLDAEGWPIGSPAQDLRRLIQQELSLTPKAISQPAHSITVRPNRTLRVLQFQTQRFHGEGRHGHQAAAAFTIEFEEPVQGPLAFGYGSHFGLGLFVPVE